MKRKSSSGSSTTASVKTCAKSKKSRLVVDEFIKSLEQERSGHQVPRNPERKLPKLEPYIAAPGDPGLVTDIEQIGQMRTTKPWIVADISAGIFVDVAEFDFWKFSNGRNARELWIDFMGKWVAGTVFLVYEAASPEDVFCLYPYVGMVTPLGRLTRGSRLAEAMLKAVRRAKTKDLIRSS